MDSKKDQPSLRARLPKPVVVPRYNVSPKFGSGPTLCYGKPFARAYSPALEPFGLGEDEFLKFIDGLNIAKFGNPQWAKIVAAGALTTFVGVLDPTGTVELVGCGLMALAMGAQWASRFGKHSQSQIYLEWANEVLFKPRGLFVRLVDSPELRRVLNMSPDAPLVLPLDPKTMWVLKKKDWPKSKGLTAMEPPVREARSLVGRTADLTLQGLATTWYGPGSTASYRAGQKAMCRILEKRRKALEVLARAETAGSPSERQTLLAKAAAMDSEREAAERGHWLLIEEIDQEPVQPGEFYLSGCLLGADLKTAFVGQFRDGVADGPGISTHRVTGSTTTGEVHNGKFNGQVTFRSAEGKHYIGPLVDGVRSGQGVVYFEDGGKYVGGFANDQINGHGTLYHPDGRRFEGGFRNGKLEGRATWGTKHGTLLSQHFVDGKAIGEGVPTGRVAKVEGPKAKDGKPTWTWNGEVDVGGSPGGFGLMTWSKGTSYLGESKGTMANGWGAETMSDGDRRSGAWNDDLLHGQCAFLCASDGMLWLGNCDSVMANKADYGVIVFPDKSVFSGTCIGARPNGPGRRVWPGKRVDKGNFLDGVLHGHGESTVIGSYIYVGAFDRGDFHGRGVWAFVTGTRFEGNFDHGRIKRWGLWSSRANLPKQDSS